MKLWAFRSALGFLTIVPVGVSGREPPPGLGRAYFPAVGAAVGTAAGLAFVVVSALTGPFLGAVAAVATAALASGGLHLDGLADFADGLFGGNDRERRLEIMRDPRIGSFGAIALFLVLLGDVAALSLMTPARGLAGLIAAGALSRLAILAVIAFVPYARSDGIGIAVRGTRRALDLTIGGLVTLIACILVLRRSAVAAMLVVATTLVLVGLAKRRIGGATGDVYGASAEVGQLVALIAFAVN